MIRPLIPLVWGRLLSDLSLGPGHVASGAALFFSGLAPTCVVCSWQPTGRNNPSTFGQDPEHRVMPPPVWKAANIPAPASGLSLLSEIVQPFLLRSVEDKPEALLPPRRFFLFSVVPAEFQRQW